jgi:lipopolysaccharide transport system permease protein
MYASPVIYPMSMVREKLLEQHVAGAWSGVLYDLYRINPLAGIIDGFQRTILFGQAPDILVIWPGLLAVLLLLPISFSIFKRAEQYFADVV